MTRWSDDKFRHRRYERSHEVCFWQGSKACSVEQATLARIEVYGDRYCQAYDLQLPADQLKLDMIERMLSVAFERGDKAARRDIREALGMNVAPAQF